MYRNIPELIFSIVALLQRETLIAQTAFAGTVLSNNIISCMLLSFLSFWALLYHYLSKLLFLLFVSVSELDWLGGCRSKLVVVTWSCAILPHYNNKSTSILSTLPVVEWIYSEARGKFCLQDGSIYVPATPRSLSLASLYINTIEHFLVRGMKQVFNS